MTVVWNLSAKEICILIIVGGVMAAFVIGVATGTVDLASAGTIVGILMGAVGSVGAGAAVALNRS